MNIFVFSSTENSNEMSLYAQTDDQNDIKQGKSFFLKSLLHKVD